MKTVTPLYKLPCSETITGMMEKKYCALKQAVRTVLEAQDEIVLTTDLWSETMTMRSYLGLTAHYRVGMYIFDFFKLCFFPFFHFIISCYRL